MNFELKTEQLMLLEYLGQNYTIEEIAIQLDRSPVYVERELTNLKNDLGVNTTFELVLEAGARGAVYLLSKPKVTPIPPPISKRILEIPSKLPKSIRVNFHDALEKTKYFNYSYCIDEFTLYHQLLEHPEFIEDWLGFSERNPPDNFFLRRKSPNKYCVGTRDGLQELILFNYGNGAAACARYAKMIIDFYNQHPDRAKYKEPLETWRDNHAD